MDTDRIETATLGGGCFWCVEAVFQPLKGVISVESGYAGGHTPQPTYHEVCDGQTGHAEVIQITFDPEVISYEQLLDVFWATHDPTTVNRQGADVGSQYRSVIFYHNEQQRAQAEASRERANSSGLWKGSIVTEIAPAKHFYRAEQYHQNYYRGNPGRPYCWFVIRPKLEKLREHCPDLLEAAH